MVGRGRPTVTMEDVAARAGVSRALVSIVFRGVPGASPETRARVMKAADALGYQPDRRARLLSSARSRTLGVVFGLDRDFHGVLVEELYRAVARSGYELALGATAPTRDERTAVRGLLEFRPEAVVLLGPTLPTAEIEDLARRVPVVAVARALRTHVVDVVRTDDKAGARLAVDHLVGLGHERIAHVDGLRAPGAAERRRGYREAMVEHGLGRTTRLLPGGVGEESGARAGRALLRRGAPTAVTVFNDACASGLLATVRAGGVDVPGALSVVGYDDSTVAGLPGVALTTVAQDAPSLATSVVDLAIRRSEEHGRPAEEVVVPPHVVVRRTTAHPA